MNLDSGSLFCKKETIKSFISLQQDNVKFQFIGAPTENTGLIS
jgi:hypothetical protein